MCVVDPLSFQAVSRRSFLGTALVASAAVALDVGRRWVLPGVAEGAETAAKSGGPGSAGVNFKWLGTDGWEITFGKKTVLLDPWLSRTNAGLFSGKFDPKTRPTVEEALIDQHITRADHILIGHGHYDHIADVPYIARKTDAMVIGSESHINMLRAYGLPDAKLVPCKGGEFLQFDGYTIEVFPSLHSLQPTKKVPIPGRLTSVPPIPATIMDMPEGDSLVYMLTIDGKFSVFLTSTANFIERAIAGLRPDVALFAPLGGRQVAAFTPRLLKAINHPPLILPTHWDNWEKPITGPPQDLRDVLGDGGNLDLIVKDIKQESPTSRVVVLKYFESFAP